MGTHRDFEKILARHCAPTLAGKKPASLVAFSKNKIDAEKWLYWYTQGMQKRGVHFFELCDCEDRKLVLIYSERLLKKILRKPNVRAYLLGCGYQQASLHAMLKRLALRVQQSGDFPHEIGLFLGYPLSDVLGFIRHGGKNYKLSGPWKVYAGKKKAQRLFESYRACTDAFDDLIENGKTIMCY
ncbi:MAG: DUF3793 family protein [Christensenella sp.]|uniref:DUF3793 family protein n=1 Tax=Christensenella sp. TaxID=1935934 RepID=UPI002B1F5834|nr:DUF3793 family protein [Christensenella sp.]MEA5003978.1 DUF3793 family protein [Christensenella sp.]